MLIVKWVPALDMQMEEVCLDLCLAANLDQLSFHSDAIWACGRRYWLFREVVVFTGVLGEGIRNLKEGRNSHLLLLLLIVTLLERTRALLQGPLQNLAGVVEGMTAFFFGVGGNFLGIFSLMIFAKCDLLRLFARTAAGDSKTSFSMCSECQCSFLLMRTTAGVSSLPPHVLSLSHREGWVIPSDLTK